MCLSVIKFGQDNARERTNFQENLHGHHATEGQSTIVHFKLLKRDEWGSHNFV